jgi:PRTRC genetic system ThiF family protein
MIYLNQRLIDNRHRVKFIVIGAGATGSIVLRDLVQLEQSWIQLDNKGFNISVYDNDTIMPHNVGKQEGYVESDIGRYKVDVLAERIGYAFGTQIEANAEMYVDQRPASDFLISCVDNVDTRKVLNNDFRKGIFNHWIDTGNGEDYGQVCMALKGQEELTIIEKFPTLVDNQKVSCSAYESLQEQSFSVNRIVASLVIHMISQLMIKGQTPHKEIWFDLKTMNFKTR